MPGSNDFGTRLRELRTAQNMTQQQLADKLFLSVSTISRWEGGERVPDITMLLPLAECLNVDPLVLLGSDGKVKTGG